MCLFMIRSITDQFYNIESNHLRAREMIITVIGSRNVPLEKWTLLMHITYHLFIHGHVIRTGGASGCDEAAFLGVKAAFLREPKDVNLNNLEVYVPSITFHSESVPTSPFYKCFHTLTSYEREMALGMLVKTGVCTYLDKLKEYVKTLFARNTKQVIANGIASDFVIYYAPEIDGVVKGGTRIAVMFARYYKIPTYNIALDDDLVRLREVLQEMGVMKKKCLINHRQ